MRAGVDVVEVARVAGVVGRRRGFLERIFTPAELADCRRDGVALVSDVATRRLAARFAAKEAARKALGTHLGWRDVEVRRDDSGRPALWVRGAPADASLSLAHDGGVAVAFVIAGEDRPCCSTASAC